MRIRQYGFSLVELMIAILLASITAVVVLNVLSNYQTRSATTVGRNDAQISAALGLYSVEREIRMAGAGLMTPNNQLCTAGANIAFDGGTISDGATLMPLRIIDGGAGTDTIEIIRSDSQFGAAPTRLVQAMASPTATIGVDVNAGFTNGDLLMVGAPDGSKICTLMQLTQAPAANGSGWTLTHAATSDFNPADPGSAFVNAMQYDIRDNVVNLGRYGIRRYGVICNDGLAPTDNNNCDLGWYDSLAFPAPALTDINSIAPQIVELQAQYGVAPAGAQAVNEWVDATGAWAAPTAVDQRRIKAVRLSLVARGNREGQAVGPASVVLWDAGAPTELTRVFNANEQRFRYQVLTVVVPLVNIIWAGI